jgi:hypothetical protein
MKMQFKLRNVLAALTVSIFIFSCQTDQVEEETYTDSQEEFVPEVVEPTPSTFIYQGQSYDEAEWQQKLNSLGNPDYHYVGINENFHVFETPQEATAFENGDLQVMLDEMRAEDKANNPSLTNNGDQILASTTVEFRISVYQNVNYAGGSVVSYRRRTINRRQTWWGYAYLENHEVKYDLPEFMRKEVSSYKMELIRTGSVLSNGTRLSMYVDLHMGLNAEGPSWEKTLTHIPAMGVDNRLNQDGDLRNNRCWSCFGIVTWNDQIQSWDVVFM